MGVPMSGMSWQLQRIVVEVAVDNLDVGTNLSI